MFMDGMIFLRWVNCSIMGLLFMDGLNAHGWVTVHGLVTDHGGFDCSWMGKPFMDG